MCYICKRLFLPKPSYIQMDYRKREAMTKLIWTFLQFCVSYHYKLCACHMLACHYIQALFHCSMYSCLSVTSGFCHKVDENCTVLGYYVVRSGKLLPKIRDNLTVPSLGVRNPKVKMGPIGCPETLERNDHYMLHNNKEEPSSQLLLQSQLTPHKEHILSGS